MSDQRRCLNPDKFFTKILELTEVSLFFYFLSFQNAVISSLFPNFKVTLVQTSFRRPVALSVKCKIKTVHFKYFQIPASICKFIGSNPVGDIIFFFHFPKLAPK